MLPLAGCAVRTGAFDKWHLRLENGLSLSIAGTAALGRCVHRGDKATSNQDVHFLRITSVRAQRSERPETARMNLHCGQIRRPIAPAEDSAYLIRNRSF